MQLLKKMLAGFISCLGIISSVLALADTFPQYNGIFLTIIGIFVGFLLGSISPKDGEISQPMSEKTKILILAIIAFVTPPLLLVGVIAVVFSIGFMTNELIGPILGWGVGLILFLYIVISCVVASHIETVSQRSSQNEKQNDQNKPN